MPAARAERLAVYTTVYPGVEPFLAEWRASLRAQTDGDFDLRHFSIANDRETLVPFIKAAQRHQPALRLWASPWSPPTWMKTNRHYAAVLPRPGSGVGACSAGGRKRAAAAATAALLLPVSSAEPHATAPSASSGARLDITIDIIRVIGSPFIAKYCGQSRTWPERFHGA